MNKESILTRIKQMKSGGRSDNVIATMFNLDEIPTLSGRGEWSGGAVYNLCKQYRIEGGRRR